MRTRLHRVDHMVLFIPLLLAALLAAGCQPTVAPPRSAQTATPTPEPNAENMQTESSGGAMVDVSQLAIEEGEALEPENALPPASITIPDAALQADVSSMQWRVTEFDGRRTTAWNLPDEGTGWHPNSAAAGAVGNVVISGHQLLGDASFAPIALGDVTPGQQVFLLDDEGQYFVYEVVDVTDPLPITADFTEEEQLAGEYTGQNAGESDTARLTLVSGWPDFSSTHRVIVTAEYVGTAR